MNLSSKSNDLASRLPHRIAALLLLIVFPLIWVGGLVTTYDAGMAVPDWPGTYGYNMFLYPLETWLYGPFDLFVEHGHRLLGSLAGLVAIGLVIATVRTEPRMWVRWMSVGLLLLVIAQGLLGGMRVLLDARLLAKIHGCVGPAFFASVAAFCVVTSRSWWRQRKSSHSETRNVRASGLITLSTLMLVGSFGQLVVGAFLRHISVSSPPHVYRGLVVLHISTALVLLLGTLTQWGVSRLPRFKETGIRSSINTLAVLLLGQIGLGFATWVVKFGWPIWFSQLGFAATFIVGEKTFWQMNLITAHVAVGSLILAFWMVHMLRCRRALGKFSQGVGSERSGNAGTSNSSSGADAAGSTLESLSSSNITQPLTSS